MARRFNRATYLIRRWRYSRRNRIAKRRFIRRWRKGFRRGYPSKVPSELKYLLQNDFTPNIPANGNRTNNLSPFAVETGAGQGQRIGQQVRFVKLSIRWVIRNNSSTTAPLAAPAVQSAHTRVIFWTPRVQLAQAQAYMGSINGIRTHIDINVVTVHRDMIVKTSPPYMSEALQNDIAGGPFGYLAFRWTQLKFNRKVKFAPLGIENADQVDLEKDVMYYTICSGNLDCVFNYETKLWYYDS